MILMSINTFKKFCLNANTKKADEIHNYYIRLEELLQETIIEELTEMKNKMLIKDNLIIQFNEDNKKNRHNLLINKFKSKKCVYIGEIEENKLIKIGSTKDISKRAIGLNTTFGKLYIIDIYKCSNYR